MRGLAISTVVLDLLVTDGAVEIGVGPDLWTVLRSRSERSIDVVTTSPPVGVGRQPAKPPARELPLETSMPVGIRIQAPAGVRRSAQAGRQDRGQRDQVRRPAGLGLKSAPWAPHWRGCPAATSILVLSATGVTGTF
jgi:hypothetical protein